MDPTVPAPSPPDEGRTAAGDDLQREGLDRAWRIAERIHGDQVDKDGSPYLGHVERVVERVAELAPAALRGACVVAAVLHDCVEDGDLDIGDLRHEFSPEVVAGVDSVTRRPDEPYPDLIERAAADPVGRWVKLADNLDNSDPERLALLDTATADRFRAKYAPARARLLEACGRAS